MFGFKKKDKKKVADQSQQKPEEFDDLKPPKEPDEPQFSEEMEEDEHLSEKEKAKREKLKRVQSKISRILQSNNIEIVDENIGDEYEVEEITDSDKQKQQDYDSLKALFGSDDKNKAKEVTLTIDDFDYTYTGKYVDELDLIHMKNIKRIRLQNKHKKLIKRLILATAIVAVIAIGIVVGINLTKETPVYLKSISLSQTSQTYFMDETFDYTGIYILAKYSDGTVKKIKLSSSYLTDKIGYVEEYGGTLKFTGGSTATLTFSYNNLSAEFTVNIETKKSCGITCKYTEGLYKLKSGAFITKDYLLALVDYENYNSIRLDYSSGNFDILVDGTKLTYDKSNLGYLLSSDLGEDSVITISYQFGTKATDVYEVNLTYGGYSVSSVR